MRKIWIMIMGAVAVLLIGGGIYYYISMNPFSADSSVPTNTGVTSAITVDNATPDVGNVVNFSVSVTDVTNNLGSIARNADGVYKLEFRPSVVIEPAPAFVTYDPTFSTMWNIKYFKPGTTSKMNIPVTIMKEWAGKTVSGAIYVRYQDNSLLSQSTVSIKVSEKASLTTDLSFQKSALYYQGYDLGSEAIADNTHINVKKGSILLGKLTVKNPSSTDQTVTFTNGCTDPLITFGTGKFYLAKDNICLPTPSSVVIKAGETKEFPINIALNKPSYFPTNFLSKYGVKPDETYFVGEYNNNLEYPLSATWGYAQSGTINISYLAPDPLVSGQ